jgi:hypothetical protein
MATFNYVAQETLVPAKTGLSAQALDSAATGTGFKAEGFNQATVWADYTYAAGTSVKFTLEASLDNSSWFIPQVGVASSGDVALDDHTFTKTGTASFKDAINIPIDYQYIRIKVEAGGSPTTSDLVTVWVTLGVVP